MSVDTRTRPINGSGPADPASFFEGAWCEAAARHGRRAAEDATRLGLPPITIRVDGAAWTLRPAADAIDVVPGSAGSTASVSLDRDRVRRPVLVNGGPRSVSSSAGESRVIRPRTTPSAPGIRSFAPSSTGAPSIDRATSRSCHGTGPRSTSNSGSVSVRRRPTRHISSRRPVPPPAGCLHGGGDGRRRCRPQRRGRDGPARRRHVVVGLHPQRRGLPLPDPRLRTAVAGAAGPDRR